MFSVKITNADNIFVFAILASCQRKSAGGDLGKREIVTDKEKSERLAKLFQRKAKIEADIARTEKADRERERREDRDRKISLGGILIAAIRKGGISESSVRALIDRYASEKDKGRFENFTFEKPETVPAAAKTAAPAPVETASADAVYRE